MAASLNIWTTGAFSRTECENVLAAGLNVREMNVHRTFGRRFSGLRLLSNTSHIMLFLK